MNDWITIFYNSIATTINITDHQGQQVNSFSLSVVLQVGVVKQLTARYNRLLHVPVYHSYAVFYLYALLPYCWRQIVTTVDFESVLLY